MVPSLHGFLKSVEKGCSGKAVRQQKKITGENTKTLPGYYFINSHDIPFFITCLTSNRIPNF
jgi:hypothetical protein